MNQELIIVEDPENYIPDQDVYDVCVLHQPTGVISYCTKAEKYIEDMALNGESVWEEYESILFDKVTEFLKSQFS